MAQESKQKALLAAIVPNVPDAVVVADLGGGLTYLNPAAEQLFGVRLEEVRGRHVAEFSAPAEQARSRLIVSRLTAGKRADAAFVVELRRADESTFPAEVTISPLFDDDGAVIGVVGMGRDITARRAAEADAARLRAIFDAAAEAVLGIDTDGTVLFFSPSAERLFGWRADEIIGRSGDDLVVPEYRIGSKRLFAMLAKRTSFRSPTMAMRRDGAAVEVELSAAQIVDADGIVTGAALTVLDVTERRRTQRWLDRIIENAPNTIAVKDLEGRYLVYNQHGAAAIGRSPDDLLGRTDHELFRGDIADRIREHDEIVLSTGEPHTFSFDFVRRDGHRSVMVTTKFPVTGPGGTIEGLGMIASDVTEVRRAEADQAQLATLVEAAPDAIVARDEDGRVLAWNPGAEAMFGLSAAETIGHSELDRTVPPDARAAFDLLVAEALGGRTTTRRLDRCRVDGSRFPAQVSIAPLVMYEGTVRGTLAIIRDISDLVAAERKLEARAALLERSNTELERFAYAASHDLQVPLQSITLSATAVLASAEDRLDPDERELLTHIYAAASRLSSQIRDLMQVAQVALGAGPREQVPVAVAVRDAVEALRGVAVEAAAEIIVHEPLPDVHVPRTEVSLVLQNLIANAIRYRREDEPPQVEITGVVGAGSVAVRVRDNGVGLSEEDMTRVFGLFERGTATGATGTGLGLAVARRMLERHGGRLVAHSDGPGKGSEFVLRLPLGANGE